MAGAYKLRYGFEWPVEMPDPLIGLTIGKKWREYAALGFEFKDPWVPMLESVRSLLPPEMFKVSEWTEQHFHDWVMYDKLITWGCASSSKSNDTGILMLADWAVDPYDTVILLGSTTKQDLKSRSWESVVRYHRAFQRNNGQGFLFPGKVSKQGQAIVNVDDDDSPESAGEKAGIQGRALNEDGRLQGAHAKYVRLVVDELAEITNHDAIKTAITNLRVGTTSFKFVGLANPASWENPSCRYCIPPDGISSVNVDTGSWMSTSGYFVRHHDGLKSPCILHPELEKEFPFLMTRAVAEANLMEVDGNTDAPAFWKMVRGFPVPVGDGTPVILDARVAVQQHATDRVPISEPAAAACIGIDPAWSSGGDGAVRARAYIRFDLYGKPYLDFTDGVEKLKILASSPKPPVQQMREQAVSMMQRPQEAGFVSFELTAIDASANQGLADEMTIQCGANCLAVNYSVRASDAPLRYGTSVPTSDTIYDRGTESWCVLAEFVRAGMVRGLPDEALRGLTMRRYDFTKDKNGNPVSQKFPLRLEPKKEFKIRFKKSPDETDACALAALVAKERFGLMPYGFMPEPVRADQQVPQQLQMFTPTRNPEPSHTSAWDGGSSGAGYMWS